MFPYIPGVTHTSTHKISTITTWPHNKTWNTKYKCTQIDS